MFGIVCAGFSKKYVLHPNTFSAKTPYFGGILRVKKLPQSCYTFFREKNILYLNDTLNICVFEMLND